MKSFLSERFYHQKQRFNYSEEFLEKIDNDKKIQKNQIFERLNYLNERRKRNLNFLARKNCENLFLLKDGINDDKERKELLSKEHYSTIGNGGYHDNNDNFNCFENVYYDKNIINENNNDNQNHDGRNYDNNNGDNDNDDSDKIIDISSHKIDQKISRNSFKNKTKVSNCKDDIIAELNNLKGMTDIIEKTKTKIYEINTKTELIRKENENKIEIEKENLPLFSENNFVLNIAFSYEKISLLSASLLNIKDDENNNKKNKVKVKENEIATILLTNNTINNDNDNYATECQSKINEIASNNKNSNLIADQIIMHKDTTDLTALTVYGNGLIEDNKNNSNHTSKNNNKDMNKNYRMGKKTGNIKLEMYEHLCQYGIAIVVKNQGSAVRDGINMDDSEIVGR